MGGANVASNEISKAKALSYKPGQMIPGTSQRVVREIGRGGFSTVYLTFDVELERQHATKVLDFSRFDSSGDDYRTLFALETKALALLEHENICRVYAAGRTNDEFNASYCVLEYLQGCDLHTLINIWRRKKWTFGVENVLNLAIGILDGLSAAHAKGVIHRDLKPANIFLQLLDGDGSQPRDSRPKLIDFGTYSIAGHVEENAKGEKVYRGTYRYSAPEQWTGDAACPQTDLYAVGIVLYEVITGATPFHRFPHDDHKSLSKAHLREKPRPIREINANVPEALAALVESLLEKKPEQRGLIACSWHKSGTPPVATAKDVVERLRAMRNQLIADAAASQDSTSPNMAISFEDDSSEGRSKPHPLLRPGLTDIAKTDFDMPEWLERLRRGEPAEDELGPEPEPWVPITEEDRKLHRELSELHVAAPRPPTSEGDVSADNSVPTSDLRPEVTKTAPLTPVDVLSADTPFEPRVIPTRTISIAEVPPVPPARPAEDADAPYESTAAGSNIGDLAAPPSAVSAVTQGPIPASADDSSSLNRYVESPLENVARDDLAPVAQSAPTQKKAVMPVARRSGGLWRALTDTWTGLIVIGTSVGLLMTFIIFQNPGLFSDSTTTSEASPVANSPAVLVVPTVTASASAVAIEAPPRVDGDAGASVQASLTALPTSASASPPDSSARRPSTPKTKPAASAPRPSKPNVTSEWLDLRK